MGRVSWGGSFLFSFFSFFFSFFFFFGGGGGVMGGGMVWWGMGEWFEILYLAVGVSFVFVSFLFALSIEKL